MVDCTKTIKMKKGFDLSEIGISEAKELIPYLAGNSDFELLVPEEVSLLAGRLAEIADIPSVTVFPWETSDHWALKHGDYLVWTEGA